MNAVTLPSFTLPMRMPRFQPSWILVTDSDSESAEYSRSLRSMKRPLGRLNCVQVSSSLPC